MSALKLFESATCPYCQRVAITVLEKNVNVEKVHVPHGPNGTPEWYKKINPNETIPTLQAGEKFVFESNLIAKYLDNLAAPQGSLGGPNPTARHRVEFFIHEAGDMTSAFYGLLRNPLCKEARQKVADNVAYIECMLAEAQNTGPFFLDDTFSMADIAIVPFLVRFKTLLSYFSGYDIFKNGPRLKKLYAAALARESVRKTTLTPQEYITAFKHFIPEEMQKQHANAPGYVLYSSWVSPFPDRVRIAANLKKVKLNVVEVNLLERPEWLGYFNPRETVPTLVAPDGNIIHDSQLIVNYLDDAHLSEGVRLRPASADGHYDVDIFVTYVGHFMSALFGAMKDPAKKEDIEWACANLVDLLGKRDALNAAAGNAGALHGGKELDAADISIVPVLARMLALQSMGVVPVDVFEKYPRLHELYKAGIASDAVKGELRAMEEYAAAFKVMFANKA